MSFILWSMLQEAGMAELIASMLNPVGPMPNWELLLLAADPPQRSDLTLSDITEPTVVGYGRRPVPRSAWVAGVPAAGCVHATQPAADVVWFNQSGTATIYGAAYLRPADAALVCVFRFLDTWVQPWEAGRSLTVSPAFTLNSGMC